MRVCSVSGCWGLVGFRACGFKGFRVWGLGFAGLRFTGFKFTSLRLHGFTRKLF